jgi:tetratricopeptide (TPR) repeat protein
MQSEPQESATKQPGTAVRLLQRIASLYGRGDLEGAEEACRQLLQLDPAQADALHVLGLVAWRRGEHEQALEQIRKAIASDPRKPQPHNSLAVMLRDLGDFAGAEAAVRTAVDRMPDYPEALTNLGNILRETGRLADAEATHRRVVALAPHYADGHNNLATVLAKQERWEEAIAECRLAVGLLPARADFHINLGNALTAVENWEDAATAYRRAAELAPDNADAHANLGLVLHRLDQLKQAVEAHRRAAALCPQSARIWVNLSAAEADLGQVDSALDSSRRALSIDPGLPEAHNAVGMALKTKGMAADAIAAFETALRLRPDYDKAYNNLGNALHAQGRFDEAMAAYGRAVALTPDYAEAQCNKGMLHLLLGEFEPGWRGYEYGMHIRRARSKSRDPRYRTWEGEELAGKTIMLSAEQGVGDQIMFASLLPDLLERQAACVVRLDDRLQPLLQRSIGGLTFIAPGDTALDRHAIDFQAPIGSLCRWLRPDLASFPSRRGYLKADATQRDALRSRYRQRFQGRPIVGISWRGGSGEVALARSMVLTAWRPLLAQRDVGFVNLQYGDCRADLAAVRSQVGVEIFHDETMDPLQDLDAFAAQTAAMDLVISIDNSTVHMAGALDVPVWVLLPAVPDWRWMLGRSDSPWYASVRLFRQPSAGAWAPVIDNVAGELGQLVRAADAGASP